MSLLKSLRGYMNGEINESTLQRAQYSTDDDITEYENDTAFMQECTADCMPLMLEAMLVDETASNLDEAVATAFMSAQQYLIGQGLMDEASAIHISNPKLNVVHLNKQAQINRMRSIIILKMGRKSNDKAYKKYKLGQKIKKANMEELRKKFGAKADRLAKKLWARTQKSAKIATVVDKAKGSVNKK